jgi:hypothetical protein
MIVGYEECPDRDRAPTPWSAALDLILLLALIECLVMWGIR